MTRVTEACDRLAHTRGQLRQAIRAELAPVHPAVGQPATGWMGRLWDRLKSSPGTGTVVQGIDDWAARSPVPVVVRLAVQALDATVRPIARRSPLRLVAGAFVLGGLLAWRSPWRRVFTPAIVATVLPQLVNAMIRGVPRLSWIGLVTALLDRKRVAQRARGTH